MKVINETEKAESALSSQPANSKANPECSYWLIDCVFIASYELIYNYTHLQHKQMIEKRKNQHEFWHFIGKTD